MELKKRNYEDVEVEFVCESYNTRHGFAHKVKLFIDSNPIWNGENTTHYLNRTWERFRYETCMLGCISNILNWYRAELKDEFKIEKGISKLTKKYQDEFEDYLYNHDMFRFYTDLYDDIRNTDMWMY